MRPKTSGKDLPPRMLRRQRKLKSSKIWIGYYYDGRDDDGKRKEIPLGTDKVAALRKWAEMECKEPPPEANLMKLVFDRYEVEVIPTKAQRTQLDNRGELAMLRKVFDKAPIDAITPQHIAQYRDKRSAKTRANREIALFSHVWNMAREWGLTAKENPCRGVRRNKESPRDFYADDEIWEAVYVRGCQELKDAMDANYLSGQRPSDCLQFKLTDIRGDLFLVNQSKTGKKLNIRLRLPDGTMTEFGRLIERLKRRPGRVTSLHLLLNKQGDPLRLGSLQKYFNEAKALAIKELTEEGSRISMALAARIKQFVFKDAGRPKAGSDIEQLDKAQQLLGHEGKDITKRHYRRKGETVDPTR